MKPIISVEGLGKSYTIRHEGQTRYKSLREEIFKLPKRLLQRSSQSQEEFWALKDVSFDVMPGDRLGIIGRNGAGKSTLLKLLSRITEPTTGRITLRGRVASLLEVGTGFHPELTGRENIFLNGAILGMSRAEVRRKFDEIVDFAGVEKFLDTPVKRYSSGMYVRLAFAVAAHLEPEILIVDEVLAVGDSEFQKKCLGKMEDVGKEGRTVLFVSHSMVTMKQLCQHCLVLDSGKILFSGNTEYAILKYLSEGQERTYFDSSNNAPAGDSFAAIKKIKIIDQKLELKNQINVTERIGIYIEYEIKTEGAFPAASFALKDYNGNIIIHMIHNSPNFNIGTHRVICWIPSNFLNDISYTLMVGISTINPAIIHEQQSISFTVEDDLTSPIRLSGYREKVHGVIRPELEWETVSIDTGDNSAYSSKK